MKNVCEYKKGSNNDQCFNKECTSYGCTCPWCDDSEMESSTECKYHSNVDSHYNVLNGVSNNNIQGEKNG